MDNLIAKIKDKRPNIKSSSLNMYLNNLKKLNKELGSENLFSLDILENKEKIDDFLKDRSDNTKKNYYASIVVLLLTDEKKYEKIIEEYRLEMELLGQKLDKIYRSQEKTETQSKNWSSLENLQKIVNEYKKEIDRKGLFKKTSLTSREFDLVQKYVVGMLYVGDPKNNPPLRSDYIMKVLHISDYNKLSKQNLKKNYLVVKSKNKKFFHLGEYKTEGQYGVKIIPLGSKLNSVMNKWLNVNKTGDLLISTQTSKPMTPNQLTKYVIKTFKHNNKSIGISMIRHIVITELFPPKLKEKEETADLMGHSANQQDLYSKK